MLPKESYVGTVPSRARKRGAQNSKYTPKRMDVLTITLPVALVFLLTDSHHVIKAQPYSWTIVVEFFFWLWFFLGFVQHVFLIYLAKDIE
jgi:hypothetical protein